MSLNTPVDVSVIIVSYNTAALLQPCLDRLAAALTTVTSQVIVVDNGSRDASVEILRSRYLHYDIVANADNVGFGRANNQVLGRVLGRFVLLLNTDAYIEPDAIVRSIAHMEGHPRCGVLGARLVGGEGERQPCCRYFPTALSIFLLHTGLHRFFPRVRMVDDPEWAHDELRNCDWVPGCYYFVRREVIDAVGLFDPRFFLYYEEVDHCWSTKEAGWDVTFDPSTTVVHLGGESAKADARLSTQGRQISRLQEESEFLFFRKRHGVRGVWTVFLSGLLIDLIQLFKGLLQSNIREVAIAALRSARQSTSVFIATGHGRRPTR